MPDTTWTSTGDSVGATRVIGLPLALTGGVSSGTTTLASVVIAGADSDGERNVATSPYAVGDQVAYTFRVTNTGTSTASVVPTAGNFAPFVPSGTGNCRYTALAAGASYVCSTPLHTVTAAEAAQGYFVPDTTWTVTAGAVTGSSRILGAPVRVS